MRGDKVSRGILFRRGVGSIVAPAFDKVTYTAAQVVVAHTVGTDKLSRQHLSGRYRDAFVGTESIPTRLASDKSDRGPPGTTDSAG